MPLSSLRPSSLPIVIIGGPTASGKSAIAMALAQNLPQRGVIINGDALQMYSDLRILTARPSVTDEASVPHQLYGLWDGNQRGTVGAWRAAASAAVSTVLASGQIPIIVGGSGLYLRSFIQGLAEVPAIDPAVREEAQTLHQTLGGAAFKDKLAALDPTGAAALEAGDTQRLIRAYEVVRSSGQPLAYWQNNAHDKPPADWVFHKFVVLPERAVLYKNCDLRFDLMLQAGALDEVATLAARGLDPAMPIMKAVGVPELIAFQKGEMTLVAAKAKAQQLTRNYAKRQLTWFRHQLVDATFLPHNAPQDYKEIQVLARRIALLLGL